MASKLKQVADETSKIKALRACQSTCSDPCFDRFLGDLRSVHSHNQRSVPYYRSEVYKEMLHESSGGFICET